MAGVTVNPCCSIGRFCILNTNASLDHDSSMNDFSSLAPRVATGGNCKIGACSAICIGATLVHGVSIGEHTVVGAGSTVLGDIESHQLA
jgi:acetyltransferase-like isoleucine patch superfamily enzyme